MKYADRLTKDLQISDNYYRQDLSEVSNSKGYYKDSKDEDKSLSRILAELTLAGGSAKIAYETGLMRKFTEKFITDFANMDGLSRFSYMYDAFNQVTSNPKGNIFTDIFDIANNKIVQKAIDKHSNERIKAHLETYSNLETIKKIREREKVLNELRQHTNQDAFFTLRKQTLRDLLDDVKLDEKVESAFLRKTGYRHATFGDLIEKNLLQGEALHQINTLKVANPEILKSMADKHILINASGEIVNMKTSISALKKMGRSMVNDFAIPMIGINPLKLFYVDDILNLSEWETPSMHLIKPDSIQPGISRHTRELNTSYVFSNGKIYDTITGKKVMENMELARSNGGFVASNFRKMAGVQVVKHRQRWDTPLGTFAYKMAEALDLGFQDELYRQKFEIAHPATWLPGTLQVARDKFNPVYSREIRPLSSAYGKGTQFIAIPKSKKIWQKGFITQFTASRGDIGKVTKASLVPYMLMERMNRSLNVFGLGLSEKHLGSAVDIYAGMMGKRILPLIAGIAALKYIDYALENKDGVSPKDVILGGVSKASTFVAGFRERTGINDKLEKFKDLSPGVEFLEEIPLLGKVLDSKDEKEAKEYWENGYDPIRKGRWWSLGNTPWGGGRIEYWRPNVKRRVESDYMYTDVGYGSKKEYWKNHWLPNPTNPLAPIKHFITDPYHWENKHYDDRPYLMTGGINELKEIPLVGGFVDNTVGRLLKPRKKMHMEYWTPDGKVINDTSTERTPFQNITRPGSDIVGDPGMYNVPEYRSDKFDNVVYSTSSGITSPYIVPKGTNVYNLNNQLKNTSIQSINSAKQVEKGGTKYGPYDGDIINPFNPNGILGAIEDAKYDAGEIAGFYGFTTNTALGEPHVEGPRLATSDQMNSYSRAFWDKSLGGLGGDLSEIMRRFVPNTPYAVKKQMINPIRNTQAAWMPGSEYYIDFLHGDPYAKIKEGEYRLAGQGYEALHKMDDPMKMKIKASNLYGTKDVLVKDILQIDDMIVGLQDGAKQRLEAIDRVKERVKNDWYRSGLAIATDVEIEDANRNITGSVDAIIRDKTAKKGYAASQFVVLDDERYKQLASNKNIHTKEDDELNFYLGQLGYNKGYITYINKDNWQASAITKEVKYDAERDSIYGAKAQEARQVVHNALDAGIIKRGDLYGAVDRFKILGDVAPYSDNYRHYESMLSKMHLTEEEKKEVDAVKERVSKTKEKLRITPYKFKNAKVDEKVVTIQKVLDNGTVMVDGFDSPLKLAGIDFDTGKDGVQKGKKFKFDIGPAHFSFKTPDMDIDNPTMAMLKRKLRAGSKVRIAVNADELRLHNDDTYKTISAVIYDNKGNNLNRMMIDQGYAEEKKNDNSATGIHARYSKGEIMYGAMFERLSHLDTPFNKKFMQARSALEHYERTDLYGKDWQSWENPISGFLVPAYQNIIRKDPITAVSTAAAIGTLFGAAGRSRYGMLMGGTIFGTAALIGTVGVNAKEAITGEAWIPKRRREERELKDYIDKLKYVKNQRLYEQFRAAAIKHEGVDVAEIINKNKEDGKYRKNRIKALEKVKRDVKAGNISVNEAVDKTGYGKSMSFNDIANDIGSQIDNKSRKLARLREEADILKKEKRERALKTKKSEIKALEKEINTLNIKKRKVESGDFTKEEALRMSGWTRPKNVDDAISNINAEINRLKEVRHVEATSPLAAQAIMYYNESKKTAYGYEVGDPIQNMLSALDRKERKYFMPFLEADEKERKRILKVAPKYMRRALQSAYGVKVDEKEDLDEYFRKHFLPDENWAGWRADVDIDDIKVKMVKHEGMDATEFDIWEDDEIVADYLDIPVPKLNQNEGRAAVKRKLKEVLSGSGLEDIDITITSSETPGISMNMAIENDRRGDIEDYINSYGIM